MNILVTGATGFLGQALVPQLISQGYWVKATTRSKSLPPHERLTFLPIPDISSEINWQPALTGCDVVIHAAARVHILKEHSQDPLAAFRKINVAGTINLARQAAQAGIKRFIFISSSHVLGNRSTDFPCSELTPPAPHSPYALSKLEAEKALQELSKENSMEIVIIRPPLVYGPGVAGNFQRLLQLTSKNIPLPIARIKNQRSFIARKNLVDFILVCIHHPKAANEIFLISDDEVISTANLILLLAKGMQKKTRLFSFPVYLLRWASTVLGLANVYQQLFGTMQISNQKARTLLNWRPIVTLQDEMMQVAEDYLKRYVKK